MKKGIALLVSTMLLFGVLAGCGDTATTSTASTTTTTETTNGEPKQGGTLVVGLGGDPIGFNPNSGSDDYGLGPHSNIFNALFNLTMDMEITPDLARTWEFSEDGLTLTIHLAENVKWHDGEPFTSEDVKWTYETIINEAGSASSNLSAIETIECPDDNTVVFNLNRSDASLLGFMSWYGIFIMPKHIYEGTDWLTNPANQSPIGTGPFKFESWQSGVSIKLVANEDYWGDGPYLDELIYQIIPDSETEYQAWQNGEIDIMFSNIPGVDFNKYDNDENFTTQFNLYPNRTYFTFNMADGKTFSDARLREAFNLALDREQIYSTGLKGNGAVAEYYISPLFEWALNEDAKIPAQDIDAVHALLEEAGYTADANGIYMSVTIDTFSGFESSLVVAQSNLKDAGIDLVINNLEYSAWVEKVKDNRDFDVTLLAGYQGPDIGAIGHRVRTDGGNNIASYSNPRVDELLLLGSESTDLKTRAPYYQELQEILAEDLPLVFLNENGSKTVIPSFIKGYPVMDNEQRSTLRSSSMAQVWLDQ